MMQEAIAKQILPKRCELDDIRAISLIERTQEVNAHGEPISLPVIKPDTVTRRGYRCVSCDADFPAWRSVEAHLQFKAIIV